MRCPHCHGLTIPGDHFLWECVNCGRHGEPVRTQAEIDHDQVLDQLLGMVAVERKRKGVR